jgi:2'-5' RNA ligase
VARQPRSEPTARLFAALDLPDDARAEIVAWREAVLGDVQGLRLLPPESLHLTLAFIGHRPEAEMETIGAAVVGAVSGLEPARLRPLSVAGVPPRRSRLFALDLADEGGHATAIAHAVWEALEAGGWYQREKRPFWPHVTLARVRRGERPEPPGAEPPPDEVFSANEVTLYRSRLSPRGARYEVVARTAVGSRQ